MRPIVRVRGLSKRYQLRGHRNINPTLREAVAGVLSSSLVPLYARKPSRDELWVLRDISFDAAPGDVIGIVGRNGAGKSTLLKILARITKPSAGEVDIYGRVGSLLEIGTGFHPDLSGRENIYLNATILGMKRAEIKCKFDEIVAFSEVEQFLDMPVKFYSTGMYLRLAFAIAAHLEPEVLLLDEVLAVGDAPFQQKCLAKMREVSSEGRTVFFVSHSTSAIEHLCNRVFLVSSGQLSETENKEAAIAKYLEDDSHGRAENRERQIDEPRQGCNPKSERLDSPVADPQSRTMVLTRELALRAQTIEALSAEVTARGSQLNALLTSNGWRWACRLSRVKRCFVPALDVLSGVYVKVSKVSVLHGPSNHSSREIPTAGVITLPKVKALDDPHGSLAVLPSPELRQLAANSEQPYVSTSNRPDVVCFSIFNWDFRYQRPQQMMSQFSAHGHRVFYIRIGCLPLHDSSRFSLTKLKENVYQVTLAAAREPWINQEDVRAAKAESFLASLDELRRACQINEAIGYVMTPSWTSTALEAKKRWGWRLIYDCMDEWDGFPGMAPAVTRAEQRLARECDLLVVTGQRLYDKWLKLDRPMILARNAVDYDFFIERCRPNPMLSATVHPIIGYYGAITEWFDVELMIHIARKRPSYTFILLGAVTEIDVSELERLPNVRLLGQQPYLTMPEYLYNFDVCLIPFKINRTTAATDPVKVYEYLSAGKPVVSVELPELESARDLLYLARDRDHFLVQLDSALGENDAKLIERRRDFARRNTWKERYEAITGKLAATNLI